MDGFHYTRAQLDAMPDPAHAHARRGAEFTFDGEAFYELVKHLHEPLTTTTTTIFAPSFDHAVKDPKENDIAVEPSHRIVVLEGNCASQFLLRFAVPISKPLPYVLLLPPHISPL